MIRKPMVVHITFLCLIFSSCRTPSPTSQTYLEHSVKAHTTPELQLDAQATYSQVAAEMQAFTKKNSWFLGNTKTDLCRFFWGIFEQNLQGHACKIHIGDIELTGKIRCSSIRDGKIDKMEDLEDLDRVVRDQKKDARFAFITPHQTGVHIWVPGGGMMDVPYCQLASAFSAEKHKLLFVLIDISPQPVPVMKLFQSIQKSLELKLIALASIYFSPTDNSPAMIPSPSTAPPSPQNPCTSFQNQQYLFVDNEKHQPGIDGKIRIIPVWKTLENGSMDQDSGDIHWSGDLNGDGITDLVMNMYACGNYGECVFGVFAGCGEEKYVSVFPAEYYVELNVAQSRTKGWHDLILVERVNDTGWSQSIASFSEKGYFRIERRK